MDKPLLLSTASVYGTRGVVSFRFPMKTLMDIFSNVEFCDASFYLVTYDGEVLVQGLPKMSVTFDGNNTRASLDLVDSRRNARDYLGDLPRKVENDASFGALPLTLEGRRSSSIALKLTSMEFNRCMYWPFRTKSSRT